MSKFLIALTLVLVAVPGAGSATTVEPDPRSDRELKAELRVLTREVDGHQDLARKLERAGRSSSNADRSKVIADLWDHMSDAVVRREDVLGQEHTIMRHGSEVTGTTDAAKVGTPIANKKTRRRVRKGEAEEMPDALRRLTRLQTLVVSAGRLERPAIERQVDAFENYTTVVKQFGDIITMERGIVHQEIERRAEAKAAADSVRMGD